MKLKIEWLETKKPDWKVGTFTGEKGESYTDASINRTDKKGRIFPNFDGLQPGQTIEGNPWKNPVSNKWSIYPIDEKHSTTGNFSPSGANRMMKEKQEGIKESQERKEDSIKVSASMRDAVQLAITEFNANVWPTDEDGPNLDILITKWRKWLLNNWDLPF